MKTKLAIGILTMCFIVLSFFGCSGGTVAISELTLCRDIADDYTPIEPTDVFETGTRIVYLSMKVANMTPTDKLTVIWNYLDTGEEINTTDFTTEEKGSGYIGFNITIDQGFPIGSFNAEVYVNDELYETLEFSVK